MATSIQPSTLHFLIDQSINNYRVWFEDNREAYKLARANFLDFIQEIIDDLAHVDDSVHGLQAKDCAFRIYRDVRFNKDKSPYKVHFGASIKPGGRKSGKAGYYFHLEPGKSFIGGGIYNPESDQLSHIRKKISGDYSGFTKILAEEKFRSLYTDIDRTDKYLLKRVPRGFKATDPAAGYLLLTSYLSTINLDDDLLVSPTLHKYTVGAFQALHPVIRFLNEV